MTTFDSTALSVVALIGLLAASAFFSSTEIAVFSLSRAWLDERVAESDPRASILAELRDDPHRLLVTLLVGNNVVNVAISSILAVLLADRFSGGVAVVLTTVVASSVVLVFGAIILTACGLDRAEERSLTTARRDRVVERAPSRVVVVFDGVTRGTDDGRSGRRGSVLIRNTPSGAKERSERPAKTES